MHPRCGFVYSSYYYYLWPKVGEAKQARKWIKGIISGRFFPVGHGVIGAQKSPALPWGMDPKTNNSEL